MRKFAPERFFCGSEQTAGVTSTNEILIWGNNRYGELGLGHTTAQHTPQLLKISSSFPWKTIYFGVWHAIGVTENHEAYIWGRQYTQSPVQVVSPSDPWKSFCCGYGHTIGITQSGDAFVWGSNSYGELGLGSFEEEEEEPTPLPCPSSSKWSEIVSGEYHCVGLTRSGEGYVWGYNGEGELGVGTTEHHNSPQQLPCPDSSSWKFFVCGRYSTFGVTTAGKAYAWGRNSEGQLGVGNTSNQVSPQELPSPLPNSSWVALWAGNVHTIGMLSLGEVYVWGHQAYSGVNTPSTTPQLFPSPSFPWATFSCGWSHTIGITHSKEIFCWGDNSCGQLGVGDTQNRATPTLMKTPSGYSWIREQTVDLSSLLESKIFCDGEVKSKDSKEAIHSNLIALRCPSLPSISNTLSSGALKEFLRMVYGSHPSSSSPSAILLEIYKFVLENKLIDYEVEIFEAVKEKLVSLKDIVEVIRIAEEKELPDVLSLAIAALYPFGPSEEMENELERQQLSRKVTFRIGKILGSAEKPLEKKDFPEGRRTLSNYLEGALATGEGSDFTVEFADHSLSSPPVSFKTHRIVLQRLPYFRRLLESGTKEVHEKKVTFSSTLPLYPSAMQKLLQYLYSGRIPDMTPVECYQILLTQEYFSFEKDEHSGLLEYCQDKVENFSVEHALSMYRLAHEFNNLDIRDRALEMVVKNFRTLDLSSIEVEGWSSTLLLLKRLQGIK